MTTPEPNVYGDENGNWFGMGHIELDEMVALCIAWEGEVADGVEESEIDRASLSHYYVIPDPENDERFQVVDAETAGAEPMTGIRRK